MNLESTIHQELVENQGRDKTAAKINAKRLVDIVKAYIVSCEPVIDDYVGPTSDFKSNLLGGLYEV